MRKLLSIIVVVAVPLVLGFKDQYLCEFNDSCETGPHLILVPHIVFLHSLVVLSTFFPSLVFETLRGRAISALSISLVWSGIFGSMAASRELNESVLQWAFLFLANIAGPALVALVVWPKKSRSTDR